MKAVATAVSVTEHGLVVVGSGPRTRVWFLPTKKTRLSARLSEFTLPFQAPPGTPAALLPTGHLLVVGRHGESLTLELGRSPQPGPVIPDAAIDGLSSDAVAFAHGPRFFRYGAGRFCAEPAGSSPAPRPVRALSGALAIGDDGDLWLAPTWARVPLRGTPHLTCVCEDWLGGQEIVLQRIGKTFKSHRVSGAVTAITPWEKSALLLIDGMLTDLKGRSIKAPPRISSISAHGGTLWCVSKGALFETRDLRSWTRKALPI